MDIPPTPPPQGSPLARHPATIFLATFFFSEINYCRGSHCLFERNPSSLGFLPLRSKGLCVNRFNPLPPPAAVLAGDRCTSLQFLQRNAQLVFPLCSSHRNGALTDRAASGCALISQTFNTEKSCFFRLAYLITPWP
jgi:hypothetical protein